MTSHNRPRRRPSRARAQREIGLDTIDEQWKAHQRYALHVCASRVPFSDHLLTFALFVAEPEQLSGLAGHLVERSEALKLHHDTAEELASLVAPALPANRSPAAPSPHRIRFVCERIRRTSDALDPVIFDYLLGTTVVAPRYPALPEIVVEIAAIYSLSEVRARIVLALYLLEDTDAITATFRDTRHRTQMKILADIADTDLTTLVEETAPGSDLARLGLISFHGGRDEVSDVGLSRPLLFALRSSTVGDLRAGLFEETPAPQFTLEEFPLPRDEVRTCMAALRGGHPLLLAGEPGVGKTEYARALIAALGRRAHTLATAGRHSSRVLRHGEVDAEGGRITAIRMAISLLDPQVDVLIIDEADAILQSATGIFGLFGDSFGRGSYDKATLNDLLEHLPVPTLWITNDHRMIPPSAMRRFGHAVAFPHPGVETRERMLHDRLASLAGSEAGAGSDTRVESDRWARDLAARYDITPAAIDRAARIVAAEVASDEITRAEVPSRVSSYIDQISNGALAHDVRRLPTVAASFDPDFCSASEPLGRIERQALARVAAGQGLRLLFGGPPGGGKTQYALWLAKRLGRDVVLKRPSDLLSKYVGDSEKLIAAAFRGAAQAGSVLVIDEADALLYDRGIATHSWEHSQIAEFLQQIQEYTGVLIACTNRVDSVDPAIRRRFHRHVTFGPIGGEVLRPALAHIFPDITFSDADIATLADAPPLMMSDLATAAEMLSVSASGTEPDHENERSPRAVIEEIIANARARDRSRLVGF